MYGKYAGFAHFNIKYLNVDHSVAKSINYKFVYTLYKYYTNTYGTQTAGWLAGRLYGNRISLLCVFSWARINGISHDGFEVKTYQAKTIRLYRGKIVL